MKIIVADDSSTIRRIMQNMLAELNQTDLLMADGGDVVMKLLEEHGDVKMILMDWNMPVMNGIDCLKAIRANPATKDIAVVMVTSESLKTRVVEAIQCGATRYLIKPFDKDKFREVVGDILEE